MISGLALQQKKNKRHKHKKGEFETFAGWIYSPTKHAETDRRQKQASSHGRKNKTKKKKTLNGKRQRRNGDLYFKKNLEVDNMNWI